jgi:hypothetical protein
LSQREVYPLKVRVSLFWSPSMLDSSRAVSQVPGASHVVPAPDELLDDVLLDEVLLDDELLDDALLDEDPPAPPAPGVVGAPPDPGPIGEKVEAAPPSPPHAAAPAQAEARRARRRTR